MTEHNDIDRETQIDDPAADDVSALLIADHPRPLVLVRLRNGDSPRAKEDYLRAIAKHLGYCTFPAVRCISQDRLPHVLQHGCDVWPTDAVMWIANGYGKALEYGSESRSAAKIMLLFNPTRLRSTFRQVFPEESKVDRDALKREYPTVLDLGEDGTWFSRLPPEDRRIATPYESAYAKWIPGDPWEALSAIFVLGENLEDLRLQAVRAMVASEGPEWNLRNGDDS
jgi:hypothetical protein